MNYKKFAQDNQKKFGYKILEMNDVFVTIKCNKCGAIKRMQLKSLYKNYKDNQDEITIHNLYCSKYYLDICKKELGKEIGTHFHDFYRHAKERCSNPKNKDYKKYKGLFKFEDFCDFYLSCFEEYKKGLNNNYYKDLSIDRIDGSKGYEKGNIRFVTMTENLQNKSYVKPVKMTNVNTGEIIEAISIGELARKYGDIKFASVLHRSLINSHLYKKEWKIEYIET